MGHQRRSWWLWFGNAHSKIMAVLSVMRLSLSKSVASGFIAKGNCGSIPIVHGLVANDTHDTEQIRGPSAIPASKQPHVPDARKHASNHLRFLLCLRSSRSGPFPFRHGWAPNTNGRRGERRAACNVRTLCQSLALIMRLSCVFHATYVPDWVSLQIFSAVMVRR